MPVASLIAEFLPGIALRAQPGYNVGCPGRPARTSRFSWQAMQRSAVGWTARYRRDVEVGEDIRQNPILGRRQLVHESDHARVLAVGQLALHLSPERLPTARQAAFKLVALAVGEVRHRQSPQGAVPIRAAGAAGVTGVKDRTLFGVPGDLNSSDAAPRCGVQEWPLRAGAAGARSDQPTTRKENAMASLIPYDPLVDTGIDELFRGFFQPIRMEGRAAPVTVKMDVTEDDKSYTVHAEIPGVSKDDIQVTIEGNQVTLGAEVKREKEAKDGQRVLRSERFYGNAFRSLALPTEVDETQSEARYDKGVLELKLVKKAASAGKRLNVQ